MLVIRGDGRFNINHSILSSPASFVPADTPPADTPLGFAVGSAEWRSGYGVVAYDVAVLLQCCALEK